jgi:CRISPR/Cas system-associated endoribonuclease Cas2
VVSQLLLVAYDITDDTRRAGMANVLRPVGGRLQQSLWTVTPAAGLTRFAAGLASLLEPGDRLRVHRPCPACWAAIEPRPATPDPLGWLHPQILTPPGPA